MLQNEQRQVLTQRIDPKLIQANAVLQLSSLELSQFIENELQENPALEPLEGAGCAGDCIDPTTCPDCIARNGPRDAESPSLRTDFAENESDYEFAYGFDAREDEFDQMGNLEAEMTLQEHLRGLLRAAVPTEEYWIGEYLIHCLDGRGWLEDDVRSIARDLMAPEETVQRLLEVLQSFDPPGIGARNLQECLLLQLAYLCDEAGAAGIDPIHAMAEHLVRNYFDHVGARRYAKLARAAGITVERARQALEYIRACCNPFPASQFRPPWNYRPAGDHGVIRPDVIVRRVEYGYEVDVPGMEPSALNVNAAYRNAYYHIKSGRGQHTEQDRKHILEYVDRAELFLRNLDHRRQTLRRITRCIVEAQMGFLETGSQQFLRPLTRTRIARMLDIHESTVSRATANKFVQLPNQEVVGFALFFNGSLSAKDAIEQVIQAEDASNPLSDRQIVQVLQDKGICIARRTIVKYREARKIPSSTRRRR